MISAQIKPDDVIFIGGLSACSHICLAMKHIYSMSLKLQNYRKDDISGRSGRHKEARKHISGT